MELPFIIDRLKNEVAALKQLTVAQSAVNLVFAKLLVEKGVLSKEEAVLISHAYQSASQGEISAERISEWARQQFQSSTEPGNTQHAT